MIRKQTLIIILIVVLMLGFAVSAKAKKITILVDTWPPYNFKINNKIVGISTELVEAALQKTKLNYELVLYPFKRALITVQKNPNTMLYTVARIPQRENMFAWIGPLHPRKVYLFKLKRRTDIHIAGVEDIKKYHTGALSGGSVEQFFITHGFHEGDYYLVSKSDQLLKMLFKKRIDLIPGDPLDLAYQMKLLGLKYSELEKVYMLSDEGGYYMVANKNTPDAIITMIQKSLDEIMATGLREEIINKYLK
ncbi:substrate-binding periplasmic protein [Maridesulfovibrio sp.]|uniref:substrate-binding periplasmic protein n=1 Tax=Maridesulfovibrio sp. TaxID=2795000 RepID=UPI0039F0D269